MFTLQVLLRCLVIAFVASFVAPGVATLAQSPATSIDLYERNSGDLHTEDERGFFDSVGNAINGIGSALGLGDKKNKTDNSTTSDSGIFNDISKAIDNVASTFKQGGNASFLTKLGDAAGGLLANTGSPVLQSLGELVAGNSSFGETVDNIISSTNTTLGEAIGSLFGGNLTDIIQDVGNFAGDFLGVPELGITISQVISGDLGILATPALFLGIGVGDGVVTGLNFSTASEAKGYVSNAVAASGANNTGLNLVAQKLGRGVAAVAAPALSSLISGGGSNSTSPLTAPAKKPSDPALHSTATSSSILGTINLADIAGSAGEGLADGLGSSLQPVLGGSIFSVKITDPSNDTSVPGIAYAFVRGLSSEAASLGLGFLGIEANDTSSSTAKRSAAHATLRDEVGVGEMRHLWRRAAETSGAKLVNSSKTDQIVGDVAQTLVSTLTCQGLGGVISAGTVALPNIKRMMGSNGGNDSSSMKLPAITIAVTNAGNNYTLALDTMAIEVNAIPMKTLIVLLAGHSKHLYNSEQAWIKG